MNGEIISCVTPTGILETVLLFSLLGLPVNLATLIANPNCSFDDCAILDNTANWIDDFLKECHTNAETPLIIAGNVADKITKKVHHSSKATQASVTELETSIDRAYADAKWSKYFREKYYFRLQYKARIFLVAAKSQPLLDQLIKRLKLTRWWNFSGLFLILDEELEKSTCQKARHYLSTAWSNGLLSTVYLCLHNSTQNLTLYSYNPFADQAPRPEWKTIASYGTERDGHPWTLFHLELDKFSHKLNCDKIFFDKTKNLGGYPVRINGVHLPPTLVIEKEKNISGLDKYSGEDGEFAKTMWKRLNATIIEVPQTGDLEMGFTDEQDIDHGAMADVKDGKVDMNLNQRYMLTSINQETTYPHILDIYCFLTKRQGTLPLWKNLMHTMNPLVGLFMLFLISTVILLLLIFRDNKCITIMLYNTLRILFSAPMLRIPRKFTARCISVALLFLIGTIYDIFQVQISVIVTTPKSYKNINTLDELKASDYKIYAYVAFVKTIGTMPQLKDRFVVSPTDQYCYDMVMENEPVACAGDCIRLWKRSAEVFEFYVAKEPMDSDYASFVTRIEWPLLDRVNEIIGRMMSAGLPQYWRFQTLWSIANNNVAEMRNIKSASVLLPIKFNDISAIIYALMIGLIFASLIFGLELGFFHWKNKHRM